ncbi:MAG TPA: ferritin-like domain-containing protein [Pyrinomonadaceae bacterium]|nr:ferritin-like domain-containing protein [Pyrinomonadaceae bacterium]
MMVHKEVAALIKIPGGLTMKLESLRDLYVDQLKDLYNAEQQLIKALPKMAKASTSEELRAAFEDHLGQTRQHAQRIETIFEQMGEKAAGKKCKAMEGLVKEGSEVMEEDMEGGIKDAAIIAAAQRVEHYEIAGYGCVKAYATRLGDENAASLLAQTLQEEKQADELLNGIAEQLNLEVPKESEQSEKKNGRVASQRKNAA